MKRILIKAKDGYALAAYRFDPAGPPRGSVVIAPGMAVPQSFYAPFAAYLASQGYAAWTFDFRGIGESLQGSLKNLRADLTDWLTLDYDAVVHAAADAHPHQALFVVGHSFGGQAAPLLPSRERLSGLVNIAVGSGSLRHNTPRIRRSAPWMWYLLAPLLCPLFGYFPGARLGIVGNLPSGAMFQWRRWCLTPEYILSGEPGARAAYASAEYPVLALTFADDELLLEAGSRMLHQAYLKRPADYRVVEPQRLGMPRIGHFGFFKPASEKALWPIVTDWLARHPSM
ncbi:MAG: alpha/beta fold hydrolase [Rhodocyclaceae bacterium]|nr:MAG: alpha/beta fold hydrolase [Rhodocyclaceae bacterium]